MQMCGKSNRPRKVNHCSTHCQLHDLAPVLDQGCCTVTPCSLLVPLGKIEGTNRLLTLLQTWRADEDEHPGRILRSIVEEIPANLWNRELGSSCCDVREQIRTRSDAGKGRNCNWQQQTGRNCNWQQAISHLRSRAVKPAAPSIAAQSPAAADRYGRLVVVGLLHRGEAGWRPRGV
jgi:hypothetical protein